MPDQRRSSPPGRGPRARPTGNRTSATPLTGPLTVDEATNNALLLFNARLAAQAENERAERRVQKAAKTKDDAAARVRALDNDTKATAAQRAEAAVAYRAAVDAWDRARSGEPEPARATTPASTEPTEPTEPPEPTEPTEPTEQTEQTEPTEAPEAAAEPGPDPASPAGDAAESADGSDPSAAADH